MGDVHLAYEEEQSPDFILQDHYLERKKTDEEFQQAYSELFFDEKTKWMGWERHIIEQVTDPTKDSPNQTELGLILQKLIQWRKLPYSIVDNFTIQELIDAKTNRVA